MPELLASKLSREHAGEVAKLERDEAVRFARIYQAARRELLGRLSEAAPGTFTAQHYRGALAQVEAGLRATADRLGTELRPRLDAAADRGVAQLLEQIAFWERARGFGEGAIGSIQTDAIRRISRELLADRFRTSVEAWGRGVLADIQRRLGVHIAMRSSWQTMAQDIAGRLEASAIQGAQFKAERIVRTELHNALQTGHQAALEAAEPTLPGLMRQWDAFLDARTSSICTSLNGQIRGIHEPWSYQGRAIAHPPAHPSCRSTIVPWRKEWAKAKRPSAA